MLWRMNSRPRNILMTVDAVGGVWQYALGLATQLATSGDRVVLAGLGPAPSPEQRREAEAVATLRWLESPPDWLAGCREDLAGLRGEIAGLLDDFAIDLVQVNEPGQAEGLDLPCPVLAVSHSCIATWFRAVRNTCPPAEWAWQQERAGAGMRNADVLVAPSASHAAALGESYGALPPVLVVHNGVSASPAPQGRDGIVFAAGRWWDDGKNGTVLDEAAGRIGWPVVAAGATTGPAGNHIAFRSVIPLGPVPNAQARALAARCGIFVSPSVYEPFGLAALEAACAGTPLVLADIPTYRELWSDAAVFFPPHDALDLARQLDRLAADEVLRSELGGAADRRARSYTLQGQAAAMRAAYDTAAAVHAGRA
jgi:hypothetical protein